MLVFCALTAGLILAGPRPVALSPTGEISSDSRFVLLKPREWIGHPFPLLEHVNIAAPLNKGRWMVILYHADCRKCRQVIPQYQRLARDRLSDPDIPQVAFVAVPSRRAPREALVLPDETYELGRLDDRYEWFVRTPSMILLDNGVVQRVYRPVETLSVGWISEARSRTQKQKEDQQ